MKNDNQDKKLILALEDLDGLIGMSALKISIMKQVMFLIENRESQNVMLNTVLYGPPGTGKTLVGKILCKIWSAIGLIKKDPKDITFMKKISDLGNNIFQNNRKLLTNVNKVANELLDDIDTLKQKLRTLRNDEIIWDEVFKDINKLNNKITAEIYNQTISKNELRICNDERPSSPEINISPVSSTNSLLEEENFVILSREDFVDLFVGHTVAKTNRLLEKHLGKVIFIDEAYGLILDDKDSFGMEAITALNLFMSENPSLIVIFAGYKDLMQQTIFYHQPGLKSRCTWVHEIEDYDPEELHAIFRFQLKEENLDCENLLPFFKKNLKKFPGFGRDTKKLIFYSRLEQAEEIFMKKIEKGNILKESHIKAGFEILIKNQTDKIEDSFGMMYI